MMSQYPGDGYYGQGGAGSEDGESGGGGDIAGEDAGAAELRCVVVTHGRNPAPARATHSPPASLAPRRRLRNKQHARESRARKKRIVHSLTNAQQALWCAAPSCLRI